MLSTTTSKNIFLALLLSFILTFILAIVYAFHPLISAMLSSRLSRQEGSAGIAAMAGGVESFFWVLIFAEPILFLIIHALLQRERWKR